MMRNIVENMCSKYPLNQSFPVHDNKRDMLKKSEAGRDFSISEEGRQPEKEMD
jgi:hypothetical protein